MVNSEEWYVFDDSAKNIVRCSHNVLHTERHSKALILSLALVSTTSILYATSSLNRPLVAQDMNLTASLDLLKCISTQEQSFGER